MVQVSGKEPLIFTGSMLKITEMQVLPGKERAVPGRTYTLCEAFGGYSVLKRLAVTEPEGYYQALWTPSEQFPSWIGACDYGDPFTKLLGVYERTKFGDAIIKHSGKKAMASLNDAVVLMKEGRLATEMSPEEVSSSLQAVSPTTSVRQAVETMLRLHVRRLFLEGRRGAYVSDRAIISEMFSPARLEVAKETPEKWLDVELGSVPSKEATRFQGSAMVDAAGELGGSPDDCLLTPSGRVVTRWDIVMKPWIAEKLSVR